MIGAFLINPEKGVCFARFGDTNLEIEAVHVFDNRTVLFVYADGSDEVMTEEIHQDVFEVIANSPKLLVADVGNDGEPTQEYFAKVVTR